MRLGQYQLPPLSCQVPPSMPSRAANNTSCYLEPHKLQHGLRASGAEMKGQLAFSRLLPLLLSLASGAARDLNSSTS